MRAVFIGGPKHGDVELIGHAPSQVPGPVFDGVPTIYKLLSTFGRGAGVQGTQPTEAWYAIEGMTLGEAMKQRKTINLPPLER